MSSTPDDYGKQWTLDEATSKEQQRRAALQGGARYRHTARERNDPSPVTDQECKGCRGHVGKEFVRVFGKNGRVAACPQCATGRELTEGAAVPDNERDRK